LSACAASITAAVNAALGKLRPRRTVTFTTAAARLSQLSRHSFVLFHLLTG